MIGYPKYVSSRTGCKVSWFTYVTKAEAEAAAKVAEAQAKELWAVGFDFGFMCPGDITELKDGTFEVVIP